VRVELLRPQHAGSLGELFEALAAAGDDRFFHPHPLTRAEATSRCDHSGGDLYCALVDGDRVVGYGLLRGWEEGYDVPSLGIAIHPELRRAGAATQLMRHLHAQARTRGAARVRLKVYPDNSAARELYERFGYRFEPADGELIGVCEL